MSNTISSLEGTSIQARIREYLHPVLAHLYLAHFRFGSEALNNLNLELQQDPKIEGLNRAVDSVISEHVIADLIKTLHEIYRKLHGQEDKKQFTLKLQNEETQ